MERERKIVWFGKRNDAGCAVMLYQPYECCHGHGIIKTGALFGSSSKK
jgi:hypothetical protein